jgi:putative ABC transport system ATP-binding protein
MAVIRNQDVGFIFQTFNLIPVLSIRENVEYPSLLYPATRKNRSRVGELLELVGLSDQAEKRPNMLSGGQRQRVAIARALVNNPSIVFADEPTANLDHATGESIMTLLLKLNAELGTTFIFSTHDSRIMEKARRIISVEDGKLTGDTASQGRQGSPA